MKLEEYMTGENERTKRNIEYLESGVNFIDIRTAYIDEGVKIGKGTLIYPCVVIEGETEIGNDCVIGQNTKIVDSVIGNDVKIESSYVLRGKIGSGTSVGPFAYLRPGSEIGDGCKIGDFVEVKNSTIGDNTKASHLAYIGDSDLGSGINIGCGVVFVNYDGSDKHRSVVEDGAFVGCNSNLVSPVRVGRDSYVAAGSTVTKDVPEGALYVGRAKGKILDGWVEKRGILKKRK